MAKITFGELLKLAQERNPNISWESEESDTSELTTPKRTTGSNDPSTTTWEVLTIPKKSGRKTRKMPENKHDIDLKGWNLSLAANKNRFDVARALIERGDDVNARDKKGYTPLHGAAGYDSLEAAGHDSLEIARLLIEQGAEVDARSEGGYTPLFWAAQDNSTDVARLLIEKGAAINAIGRYFCSTPLHWAAQSNSTDVARMLIEHDADQASRRKFGPFRLLRLLPFRRPLLIDVRDKFGSTPLHYAAKENSTDVARLLIEKGANTDGIDLSWMDDQEDA